MPNVKLWDKEKIEALFTTDIAKCIVYIPLLDVIEEDKLVWHDDIHGHYSVKSGYSLMQKMTGKVDSLTAQEGWEYMVVESACSTEGKTSIVAHM
jgi:hypothetical protein